MEMKSGTNKNIYLLTLFIAISVAFIAPLFVDNELYDATRLGKIIFFAQTMLFFIPVGSIALFLNWKQRVGSISLFILLWFTWIILRGKIGGLYYDEKFFWWAGCFMFYYLMEQAILYAESKNHFSLIYIPVITIVLISGIESILGILQIYDKYHIYHGMFKVTGTFFNPAPFSGFLVASFPFAIYLSSVKLKKKLHQLIPLTGYVVVCLIITVVPSTQSRAGYLGLLAGFIVWSFYRYQPLTQLKDILDIRLKRILTFTLAPVLIVILLSGLYLFKKDSASGRMLIWKMASHTIREKPFIGHGFNTIQATFAPTQAAYFESGQGTESEKMLAGSVKWAFNEFLQTASETGLIGLFIMLAVVILALMAKTKDRSDNNKHLLIGASKATIVGVLVFGCFSYPFYSLPITLLFFTALAFIAGLSEGWGFQQKWLTYPFKSIITIGVLALGIFYIIQIPQIKKVYWLWDEASKMYQIQAYPEANESFAQADSLLPNNGLLLQQYGKSLFMQEEYDKAITVLKKGGCFYKDEFWYITNGDCYLKMQKYQLAEENYITASHMVPHKFYPEYLLAKLYDTSGQEEKAVAKARFMLEKDIKVCSTAIDEIKEEMRAIISKYTKVKL